MNTNIKVTWLVYTSNTTINLDLVAMWSWAGARLVATLKNE
uniref:Uncharacterized protein n=1 Tax=Anguilla anguilla TaxID=7936 RepID=A0A0E9S6X8_ANGAN